MKVEELNRKFIEFIDACKKVLDYHEENNTLVSETCNYLDELGQQFEDYLRQEGFCEEFIDMLRTGSTEYFYPMTLD